MLTIIQNLEIWNILLTGTLSGLVVAFAFWLRKRHEDKKRIFNTCSLLVQILIEIERKVERCEGMLTMWKPKLTPEGEKKFISFSNLQTPTFDKLWRIICENNSDFIMLDNISYIYEKFGFISYNIEKGNIGAKIDAERWGASMAFIRNYLLIIYVKHNKILIEVRKLAKKNKCSFPEELIQYDKKYMRAMKTHLNLEVEHLDD